MKTDYVSKKELVLIKSLVTVLMTLSMTGCTFAGVILDSTIYSKADENYDADLALAHPSESPKSTHVIKGKDTVSLAEVGFEVDSYLVSLIKQNSEPNVVCKQVSKALKVCEEVSANSLTEDKNITESKTVDEIIGVRQ
jgi:hypothetical protein